jgi:hypothetical protein
MSISDFMFSVLNDLDHFLKQVRLDGVEHGGKANEKMVHF